MGVALIILLYLAGQNKTKSKSITALILFLMWVLLAFNTVSPDGEAYRSSYDNYIFLANHYEPLYSLLVWIGHRFNFTFDTFRAVYSILVVLFTFLGCRKYTEYTSKGLSLYLVTYFVWYISGMRIALAIAITIYAVSFLLSNTKRSLILFCLILLVAVLVHYSCGLFYLLLFARQKEINWKKFIWIFLAACLFTVIVLKTDILYTTVTRFTNRDKTTQWFINDSSAAGRPTLIGLTTSLIIVFGNIVVSHFANKFTTINMAATEADKDRTVFIYNANCAMMLLLPLLVININFMRAYIGMSVITLFGITATLNQARKCTAKKHTYTLFTIVAGVWLLYYFVLYNFDLRVWEMITNNSWFLF